MVKKSQQEAAKTRMRILDAAEHVFMQWGVRNATLAYIAEKAELSRGAVYGHYSNKIDVCLAMCRRAYINASIPISVLKTVSTLDALYMIGTYFIRQCYQPCSLQRAIQILYFKCETCDEHAPLFHFRSTMEKIQRHIVYHTIRRGVKKGELPADLDLNAAFTLLDCLQSGLYHAPQWNTHLRAQFWDLADMLLRVGIDSLYRSPHLRGTTPLPSLPHQHAEALSTLMMPHPPIFGSIKRVPRPFSTSAQYRNKSASRR